MKNFKEILQKIIFSSQKQLPMTLQAVKLEIAKEIFRKHNCFIEEKDWENFLDNLNEKDHEKLVNLSHFYFFICREQFIRDNVRDEIVLVAITSIIESIMSEIKYKDFKSWYDSEFKKSKVDESFEKITIDKKINFLWNEYLKKYGATKKVEKFFDIYIKEENKDILLASIEKYNNVSKKFEKFKNIKSVAKLLYQMRSDFVHSARMRGFNPKWSIGLATKIGENYYDLKLQTRKFVDVFEQAFIEYFIRSKKKS